MFGGALPLPKSASARCVLSFERRQCIDSARQCKIKKKTFLRVEELYIMCIIHKNDNFLKVRFETRLGQIGNVTKEYWVVEGGASSWI